MVKPLLAAIPAAVGAAASSVAAAFTASSILTTLGSLALSFGLSVVVSALTRPKQPSPTNGQVEVQQPVPERIFHYGRVKTAGPLGFKKVAFGTSLMFKIVLVADGEIDAYETIELDDRVLTFDADHYATNEFGDDIPRVQVIPYFGTDDQVADAYMMSWFPGVWTEAHRLRGIAYCICVFHGVEQEFFLDVYPQGEPQLKVVIRGRKVWDPRDADQDPDVPSTWLWSDNAALCVLDWVCMHPKGYQIPLARLDIDSFETLADTCDELVPLSTGGSEKRYRVATTVSLKEPRTDVLGRLREACDAHLYWTGDGTWAIRGGAWDEPTVDIDSELGHIIEADMSDGADALSRYNELAITYLSPDHNYGEHECDPWQALTDPEFLDGEVTTQPLPLLQVPSYTQARRLAKIMMAYDNPQWIGSTRTNFYGLHAIGERAVNFNWSEAGEDDVDGPFWLDRGMTMLENGTGMQLGVRSADETSYDWDYLTEEGEPPRILPPAEAQFEEGVPPANPIDFEVTDGVHSVLATWTVVDDAFYIARLWRAASGAGFDDAVEVSGPRYANSIEEPSGEAMVHYDSVPAGTWDYYLTVENAIGDRNTQVGPETAVVTSAGAFFITDYHGRRLRDSDGNFLTIEA